ncbi:MAG: S1-like domain-containing RNA-binding protein [Eubacteriales bacterium]|nr:S1-like domain-containing RNA-binding protein [Eubacteriales bacterium]
MLQLGKKQELEIVKVVDFGVYLAEKKGAAAEERVLLPKKEVPAGAGEGTRLTVFLYKDSRDRLIATMREPMLTVGSTAVLKVKEVAKIGAFLDWGLEKDLLLPFRQQTRKVHMDEEVLVGLYVDKSDRLCATMKVYGYLSTESPYKKDDHVTGVVYEISEQFGVFVAVDQKYSALIPRREASGTYRVGDRIEARVTAVKEDGKLDITDREKAYLQIEEDAEAILSVIEEFDGVLPFTDKASPEVIKREFGLSKAAFKRGVGKLLKEGKIEITERSIRIL